MARKNKTVRFGIKNVYYAPYDEEKDTFATPEHIDGAVKLELTPEGDTEKFYAEDILWSMFDSASGYTGSLEVAAFADKFLNAVLGRSTAASGLNYETAEDEAKQFALLFEVSSNKEPQRYVLYNVVGSRPGHEHNTRSESTTPDTESMDITASTHPFTIDGVEKEVVGGHITKSTENATVWDNWYKAVQLPTATDATE